MAEYQSSYTGAEIDAGIGKANDGIYIIELSAADMGENSVTLPQTAIDYIATNAPSIIRFNIDMTGTGIEGTMKYGDFYRAVNLEQEDTFDVTSSVYTRFSLPLLNSAPDRINTQSFVIDSQTTSPVSIIRGSTYPSNQE